MILRPNQANALRDINDFINSDMDNGIVVSPVATGKSIIIAETVKLFNTPTICLQPNKELLKQNYEKYTSYGFDASIYSASLNRKDVGQVTYATIGSIVSDLESFLEIGVQNIISDECFTDDTPVVLEDGISKIGDLYRLQEKGVLLSKVMSYNEKTDSFEPKKIVKVKNNGVKDVFKVTMLRGASVKCTDNHRFLTVNGWKMAKDLQLCDSIISNFDSSHITSNSLFNKDQFDLIIGGIIGDGCMRNNPSNEYSRRMSFIQGEKQEGYLKWKAQVLGYTDAVRRMESNGYSGTVAYKFNTKSFYFNSKGNDNEYAIDMLNEKSLAVLWGDDGHMDKLQNSGSLYSFCNNEDLVIKLNNKLIELGVNGTIVQRGRSSSTGKELFYIRFKKQAISDISRICASYVHPDLSYKINDDYRHLVGTYVWDNMVYGRVVPFISIEKIGSEVVYDMEVEGNHNYVVTFKTIMNEYNMNMTCKKVTKRLQGIVVHNCHYSSKEHNQLAVACKFLKIKKKVGLTATPIFLRNSQDGSFLQMMSNNRESIFRNIIHVTQIQDIQQYWTPINYKYSKEGVNSSMLQLNTTGRDYTAESMKKFYDSNSIEYKILRSITYLKEQGINQALIFVPSVAEAESIANQIVGGELLHGGTKPKERERIVEGFKNANISYVINVDVLGTGFDYPKLPAIIHGRPTNSFVTYYQHIGRVVRTHPDKKEAWFLDLVGNVQKFGKIEGFRFEQDAKGKWEMWDSTKKITHNGFKPKIISMSEILELEENIRSYVIMTGKYKNYNLVEVVKRDKRYLQWMASDKYEPLSENAQKDKESAIIALKHFNII